MVLCAGFGHVRFMRLSLLGYAGGGGLRVDLWVADGDQQASDAKATERETLMMEGRRVVPGSTAGRRSFVEAKSKSALLGGGWEKSGGLASRYKKRGTALTWRRPRTRRKHKSEEGKKKEPGL